MSESGNYKLIQTMFMVILVCGLIVPKAEGKFWKWVNEKIDEAVKLWDDFKVATFKKSEKRVCINTLWGEPVANCDWAYDV